MEKCNLYLSNGFIVKAQFNMFSFDNKEPIIVKITNVVKRYGEDAGDLIIGILLEGQHIDNKIGDEIFFSKRFVVEIIEKKAGFNNYNLYRDRTVISPFISFKRNEISGSFYHVFQYVLSTFDMYINRNLSHNLYDLYFKNKIGLKKIEQDTLNITVDRKKFTNWVKKNIDRILMTAKEMHEQANRDRAYWDKTYEEDCMAEYERE